MTPHPPKPRFALRVGITGHRPNKLPTAAVARVDRQLKEVFAAVESAVASIHRDNADVYDNDPLPEALRAGVPASGRPFSIRLISGFAEGADQMAVAVCPADWTVEAVLPFPKDEYLKDFEQSAAGDGRDVRDAFLASLARANVVTEIPMPRSGERNHGYVMSGGFMLRQVDVLVAVWDGGTPKPGGTGAIAKEARQGGIPVVWVSTVEDTAPRFIARFDGETPLVEMTEWSEAVLTGALLPILAAPPAAGDGHSPRLGLERFYREHWRPVSHMPYYDMMRRMVCGLRPVRRKLEAEPFETSVTKFEALIDDAPKAEPLNARLKHVLAPRYVWADALAVHFSHAYRSAYVLAYLLAALAVLFALGGAFVHTVAQKAVVVLAELVVIAGIVLIVGYGRRHAWHERWIDYRAVAESLRHGRFLAFVSEFGNIRRGTGADQPWTIWYIRACMREIGMPHGVLDGSYQRPLLRATQEHEVWGQIAYHHDNAHAMHEIDHFLHRAGNFCFLFTLWMLIGFLVAYGAYLALTYVLPVPRIAALLYAGLTIAKSGMIVLAAGLPALGAALHGIKVQGDFDGSKERSERMVAELGAIDEDFSAAIARQPELDETAKMLIETAGILSEDLAAWQDLYGRKRLNLPA